MNSTQRLLFISGMIYMLVCVHGVPVEKSSSSASLCEEISVQGSFVDPSDTDCTSYIYCFEISGEWRIKYLKCPEGQFYNEKWNFCTSNYTCTQ
ncbi:uncharacterized protein LOC110118088 [Ceratitis capitata]|uniref:uncharacterized protein LOC110118088 n=1 Tax=Ceratitis capitata TaxID=7213 RepID=UPI000A11B0E1|nr:uncharacterized protein LOC110118088 [Ceratitis capitata]